MIIKNLLNIIINIPLIILFLIDKTIVLAHMFAIFLICFWHMILLLLKFITELLKEFLSHENIVLVIE